MVAVTKTIVVLGSTATGKTKLSIELAQKLNGEIISADSMQVYRGMNIGTAKPNLEERQGIPHYLIDVKDPDEEWTVSDFVKESQNLKIKIQNEGKTPIIVGGTGLYLWSLVHGFSFPGVPANQELRAELEKAPLNQLYNRLLVTDSESADRIHPNDRKRIIRALEVCETSGQKMSDLQKARNAEQRTQNTDYTLLGLTLPREKLYQRVEARVDQMIAHGLINEVKGLLQQGYDEDLPALQGLGYKEIIEHLKGQWLKQQTIAELKKRTRNFARRQMTWFKRFEDVKWFESPVDSETVLDYIKSI